MLLIMIWLFIAKNDAGEHVNSVEFICVIMPPILAISEKSDWIMGVMNNIKGEKTTYDYN